jgi:diguanylate cyclase (GGDEF)-like protein
VRRGRPGPARDLTADLADFHRIERGSDDPRVVGLAFIPLIKRHLGLDFAGLLFADEERGKLLLVVGPRSGRVVTARRAAARSADLATLLRGRTARRWTAPMLPRALRAGAAGGVAIPVPRIAPGTARLLVAAPDAPRLRTAAAAALVAHLATALENLETYRKTLDLSLRDELTRVFNYRFLLEALERETQRSKRYQLIYSVAMLDLDNLKQYNDRFGHLAGSEVLRVVGRIIETTIRRLDIAAKYGGDEFAVIFPDTGKKGAVRACERIRQSIARQRFRGVGGRLHMRITTSIGVATYPEDGQSSRALLRKADRALFRAKANGRNCVCT